MPVARAHVQSTLDGARRAIDHFRAHSRPVVAIGNEFKRGDAVMNLLRRYASMEGSKGARWDERVPLAGLTYFPKWASSAFVNPEFEAWLRREGVKEIVLGGMFASACVTATAKDALRRGFRVRLLGPRSPAPTTGARPGRSAGWSRLGRRLRRRELRWRAKAARRREAYSGRLVSPSEANFS